MNERISIAFRNIFWQEIDSFWLSNRYNIHHSREWEEGRVLEREREIVSDRDSADFSPVISAFMCCIQHRPKAWCMFRNLKHIIDSARWISMKISFIISKLTWFTRLYCWVVVMWSGNETSNCIELRLFHMQFLPNLPQQQMMIANQQHIVFIGVHHVALPTYKHT